MKHTTRITLLTLAISGLLLGQSVLAEPTNTAAPAKQESASVTVKQHNRQEKRQKHLEMLKSNLKLNASQEAAWTEWVDTIKEDPKDLQEMRDNMESWSGMTAIERMEKKLAFLKERVTKQEARLAATKKFYDTLSPEQRLIFDKDFNAGHHRHNKHEKK